MKTRSYLELADILCFAFECHNCRSPLAYTRAMSQNFCMSAQRFREIVAIPTREAIEAAYPIHPEVFDRVYTDWARLMKFHALEFSGSPN